MKSDFEKFCVNCQNLFMRFDKYNWDKGENGFYKGQMHATCGKMNYWNPDKNLVDATVGKKEFDKKKKSYPFKFDTETVLIDSLTFRVDNVPSSLKEQMEEYAKTHHDCLMKENNKDCEFYLERTMEEWNGKNAKNLE